MGKEGSTPLSNIDSFVTSAPDGNNLNESRVDQQGNAPDKKQMPRIEVHGRDFLASLSRVMQMNDQYFRKMFENDAYSKQSLLKALDLSILSKFNSMNVGCILPRVDQNLTHTPALGPNELGDEFSQSNLDVSRYSLFGNKASPLSDHRASISEEVMRALCQ